MITLKCGGTPEGGYGPIWHLALATGLRRGELLGLRWQDVDLTKCEPHIHQSAGLLGGKTVLGPTKTKTSKGTVPMPVGIAEKLKTHGARQKEHRLVVGDVWHDHGLVFPSEVGTLINPNNLIREFARLVVLAGVPRIRIHDLRHTWASRRLNKGIPNVLISALTRHGRVSTTGIYGHADTDMLREAAERSWEDMRDDSALHR